MSEFEYGHVFWNLPEKMYRYSEEDLKSWSSYSLLKMHYYLTMRLDGYGHLSADESIKHNCELFRAVLRDRKIDAVRNVIDNQMWYDWGYRTFSGRHHLLKETK